MLPQLTMGLILNSSLSLSPWAKNSMATRLAICRDETEVMVLIMMTQRKSVGFNARLTLFCSGQGFAIAERSLAVISIDLSCTKITHKLLLTAFVHKNFYIEIFLFQKSPSPQQIFLLLTFPFHPVFLNKGKELFPSSKKKIKIKSCFTF